MSSLITFLWYCPASYQHPGTPIQLTFLHFDLKSVSCLESFNRYCTSIRGNEASKPVLLILNHLSWFLVVSASFILFLFFLMCLEAISLILTGISFWITGLSFGKSAFSPGEGFSHLLSHLVVSILCDPTTPHSAIPCPARTASWLHRSCPSQKRSSFRVYYWCAVLHLFLHFRVNFFFPV